jgi:hypothetical protein
MSSKAAKNLSVPIGNVDTVRISAYIAPMTAEQIRPVLLPDGTLVPLGSLDPKYWIED